MAGRAQLDDNGLSVQESLFCDAYFVSFNATEAAKQAGYAERSAYSQGAKLLAREHVQKELQRRRAQMARKFKITAERLLEEYSIIAYSSIEDYLVDDDGRLTVAEGVDRKALRAISGCDVTITRHKDGSISRTVKPRLWNKPTALHDLGDHKRLFGKDAQPIEPELTPEQREAALLLILKRAAQRQREQAAAAASKKAPAKKAAAKSTATPQARRTR